MAVVKATRRKRKSPKTIDLKADAIVEESNASMETDAAIEAGLNPNQDTSRASVEAPSAKIVDAEKTDKTKDTKKEASSFGAEGIADKNLKTEEPMVTPPKKKNRAGFYAGTFLSALVGGGIAIGGAGALNEAGLLKYVPFASGLIYGGDTSSNTSMSATVLEGTQTEISLLKEQIAGLKSAQPASISPELLERIAALEAAAQNSANIAVGEVVDLTKIESALADVLDKSNTANQNSQDALAKISELSKTMVLPSVSGVADTATISKLNGLTGSLATMSERMDVVEKGTRESSAYVAGQLASMNDKIKNEILAPMAEVKAAASAALTGQKVARSVSARSLKSALENGGRFSSEVLTVQALLGTNETITALMPLAEKGVQTTKQLAVGFKTVEDDIFQSQSIPQEDDSVINKFLSSAKSLVKVRPKGVLTGDGAVAIASRIRGAVEDGNLDVAKTEWEKLPDAAKELSANWMQGLEERLSAEGLIATLIKALSVTASAENKG